MKQTKLFAMLLVAVMLISSLPIAALAANNTFTLQKELVYDQTEARRMLPMINELRKPGNAWYWNSDNTTKTTPTDLNDLVYDYGLEKVAMQRAAEIALMYDHQRPNGEKCFTAYTMSYSTAGENIAWGYNMLTVAEEAFDAWSETNDPYSGQGHRRNMLKNSFMGIGIGHVIYNGRHYWVQEFIAPLTGAAYTEPVDTAKTVNIPFNADTLEMNGGLTFDWSPDKHMIELPVGVSGSIPVLRATVNNMTGDILDPNCTISPASVAKIQNGKIVGVAPGNATLSVTACGATKTIPITVTGKTTNSEYALGDVDGNGKIEAADARLALRASVHLTNESTDVKAGTAGYKAADYDKNGTVEASDARCILRVSVKLDPFG